MKLRLAATEKVAVDDINGHVELRLIGDDGASIEIEAPIEAADQLWQEIGWLVASLGQQQRSSLGGKFNFLQPVRVTEAGAMPSMDGRAIGVFLEAHQSFRIGWALDPQKARQLASGLVAAAEKADRIASGKPS